MVQNQNQLEPQKFFSTSDEESEDSETRSENAYSEQSLNVLHLVIANIQS